jgi:hypothetical protein
MKKLLLFLFTAYSYLGMSQVSDFILVDQFGYTTTANKIAILRDPQTGYDASASYIPATNYVLVNTINNSNVLTIAPTVFNGGATDAASGDKVWWLDFSQVVTEGSYYIKESTTNVRSVTFVISDTVYKSVLKASLRMLYYQRAGIAKTVANAGAGWADGASHVGALQDKNARLYNNKVLSTEKDISGGWYDAGDYNQYTPWTANYVIELLKAYQENPTVWTDDYNIPESGNGIPDIIDEVKWGMDWLLKMNQNDGSSLCVLGRSHASPPSSATGQSLYGPATTHATAKSASAFALGAKIFKQVNPTVFGAYSTTLETKAKSAWTWTQSNTNVQFANNSASNGSQGLAAGNQETEDDLGRLTARLEASVYLFELTNDAQYKTFFDATYTQMPLIAWYNYASQYYTTQQEVLMYYTKLPNATVSIVTNIKNYSNNAFNKSGDFFAAFSTDAYRSFVKDYNWGSNSYKALYGNMYRNFAEYDFSSTNTADYKLKAEEYLHYIHGVNAMGFCYLTNMSSYGAEKSINEIYHTWFKDGSVKWDRVGTSTYGPAPGFLAGGAYTSYNWDACCPSGCGSIDNNNLCTSISITPPVGQPKHKSYKDFNNNWPLNSWSVTEPSLGYQVNYIRLLSKYVKNQSTTTSVQSNQLTQLVIAYPNPAQSSIELTLDESIRKQSNNWDLQIINAVGATMYEGNYIGQSITVDHLPAGLYQIKLSNSQYEYVTKFIKQ